jgi:lipopolysaccharide transport system ATP-binding protein
MSSDDVAISVKNLSKCYQIYAQPRDRLKQFVLPRFQRLAGQAPKSYFNEFWALRDVSFDIKKGEVVGIIGRNGSGKSTLLQIICGTLHPTSGDIQTHGRIAALLELGSGFNPEFTGRDNIYLNASLLGLSHDLIAERFDSIVEFSGINDFINQPVKTYSSGMAMKLAFSVIAHVDADILVVDEALSVGDAFFTQKCMRFFREFLKRGTILFVSHDTGAIISLCNKAVHLENGIVKSVGTPKDIVTQYLSAMHGNFQPTIIPSSGDVDADISKFQKADDQVDSNRAPVAESEQKIIEKFEFQDESASIGSGGAEIISVTILDANQSAANWLTGGEDVSIRILCTSKISINGPIIGFQIKDRLGQVLFGANTFSKYCEAPLKLAVGQIFSAIFTFRLPLLPTGDYSINAAIAEGTQESHVQHHWIDDALIFKVHARNFRFGVFEVEMDKVLMAGK